MPFVQYISACIVLYFKQWENEEKRERGAGSAGIFDVC